MRSDQQDGDEERNHEQTAEEVQGHHVHACNYKRRRKKAELSDGHRRSPFTTRKTNGYLITVRQERELPTKKDPTASTMGEKI